MGDVKEASILCPYYITLLYYSLSIFQYFFSLKSQTLQTSVMKQFLKLRNVN